MSMAEEVSQTDLQGPDVQAQFPTDNRQINESVNYSNIESWFKAAEAAEAAAAAAAAPLSQRSKPRIQWAPSELEGSFPSCFSPKVLLLGPIYHYRDDSWRNTDTIEKEKERIHDLKLDLAVRFINDYSLELSVTKKILKNIKNFRQYYNECCIFFDVNGEDHLRRMFIEDGCALLLYIVCYVLDDLYKLGIRDVDLCKMHEDIFKLENQLPYSVLEVLMECSKLGKEMPSLIHDFVKLQSVIPGIETSKIGGGYKPDHLLELMWVRMTGIVPSRKPHLVKQFAMALKRYSFPTSKASTINNQQRKKGPIRWSPSHSVKNLKVALIHLKPGSVLKNISFRFGIVSGEFELPRLIIDKSTRNKLLNLIAYEMLPGFEHDLEITSYICFLHSFIADEEDVAQLRSTGVLINSLSNDRVRTIFSEITAGLVPNPANYHAIHRQIQEFLDRKERKGIVTWFAEVAYVYFKTPWSTMTVLAATFVVIVMMVQTYFIIFSRK